MKTSKCQLIYRNVSKTFDHDNEKTLKVDKIEFFGNFPRNVFCICRGDSPNGGGGLGFRGLGCLSVLCVGVINKRKS